MGVISEGFLKVQRDEAIAQRDALRNGLRVEVEHCRDEMRKADEVARDWNNNDFRDGEAQAYSYVADRLSALLDSGGEK
jgi:hypothetical protein